MPVNKQKVFSVVVASASICSDHQGRKKIEAAPVAISYLLPVNHYWVTTITINE